MKKLLATTAIIALATNPVLAESHSAEGAMNGQEQSASMQSGDMTIRATNLIDNALYMPEGEFNESMMDTPYTDAPDDWRNVADVEDVLITPEGEINAVIIDAGGFLGMGEKQMRVEMDNIRVVPDDDDEGEFFLLYTGSRQLLEDGEAYDRQAANENNEMSASNMLAASDATAQDDDTADDEQTAENGSMTENGMAEEQQTAQSEAMQDSDDSNALMNTTAERDGLEQMELGNLQADELEGARVYGSDDNWVGEVETLVLSDSGQIDEVIVDVGGFLGIGEKPVAMAFDELDIRRDGSWGGLNVYVDATESELDAMDAWTREG